jgi:hypothetical protein
MMPGNFGPLPAGATILMQTEGAMLMYADTKGRIWRYLYRYDQRWPVEFDPPIDVKRHAVTKHGLTEQQIEDLI